MLAYQNKTSVKHVAFRTMADTKSWGLGDEPHCLVVTQESWPIFYSRRPSGANFAVNVYLVASRGMKPNPAYTIRFIEINQLEDEVRVSLDFGEPEVGEIYPQVVVYPIAVAEVAKADLRRGKLLSFIFLDDKGKPLAVVKRQI